MFLLSAKIFSSEIDYTTLRYGFLVFNLAKKSNYSVFNIYWSSDKWHKKVENNKLNTWA